MTEDRSVRIADPERLAQLHALHILDTPAEAAFDRLTRLAARLLDSPMAILTFVEAEHAFIKSSFGMPAEYSAPRQIAFAYAFCRLVVLHDGLLAISDTRLDPQAQQLDAVEAWHAYAFIGVPLHSPQGQVMGALCVLDMQPRAWSADDQRHLADLAASVESEMAVRTHAQERQALISQMQELEQLKSDMMRIAVHDLKNPLNVILGYSVMLQEAATTTAHRDYAAMIEAAAHDMNRIVTDILSLERIEQIARAEIQEEVALALEAQALVDLFQADAELKQIQLSTDLDPAIQVRGDSIQLREAMRNLILNAIKYTPTGGQITIRLRAEGGDAVFIVTDTGYGIPEDQQERIFQPFIRAVTPETELIKGTGLGLHIVRNVIQRHHGQIVFHSVYHQGSTFGFRLPAV